MPNRAAQGLLCGLGVLGLQHLLLGPPRPPPLLPAGALDLPAAPAGPSPPPLLGLVREQAARHQAIGGLASLALALHHRARRAVHEHHARGDLVDVLAALAARLHERLVEVLLADSEPGQPFAERARPVSDERNHPM